MSHDRQSKARPLGRGDASPLQRHGTGVTALGRWARLQHSGRLKLALWGLPVIAFILAAIFGPIIVEYNHVAVNITARLEPPGTIINDGTRAWLGTDQVGKDVLAQVFQGARVSLLVGGATILLAGSIGLFTGVIAGYVGGWVDIVLMRIADIQLAFPSILLAILMTAVLGPSILNVIIALGLTRWVVFGRVARAATLAAKERDYVLAARAMGADSRRLLVHHIVPSTIAPLIVIATVEVGLVIIAEASLSYLGLGSPASQPSWGRSVANGRDYLNNAWWISTMPGLALSLVVLAVGMFGDRLRDYLDPRM
jgi:peptide/nickel transport system permease protein